MLYTSGVVSSREAARSKITEHLANRKGLVRLADLIAAQGGDPSIVSRPERLPQAREKIEVQSETGGYVSAIDALQIGLASKVLGAGRTGSGDAVDHSAGIYLKKKIGDPVAAGEPLAVLHTDGDETKIEAARQKLLLAFSMNSERIAPPKLIRARITKEGIEEY
jgi:pyrimidine-nucleoside phosphorylase